MLQTVDLRYFDHHRIYGSKFWFSTYSIFFILSNY